MSLMSHLVSNHAEIRLAILDGNMQCAEQLIRASFPAFVEARADVLFHLAIQAFVERTRHEMRLGQSRFVCISTATSR